MLDGPLTLCHTKAAGAGRHDEEVNAGNLEPDARQTRADHGRGQQPLDRLGHRARLPRPWRRPRLHLSGRGAEKARRAVGRGGGRPGRRPLRRHRSGNHRCGVRRRQIGLGLARFRAARHRVFRQGPARRPLCRHHRGQFHQDHAGELLFVHGHRAARRKADDQWRLAAHADLLRRREMDAALQCDGAGQGRAGILGALSGRRSRRQEHPRQRHFVRADQDAGRLRHRRFPLYSEVERIQHAAAPQCDAGGCRQDRRLFPVRHVERRHRRNRITSMPAITSSASSIPTRPTSRWAN